MKLKIRHVTDVVRAADFLKHLTWNSDSFFIEELKKVLRSPTKTTELHENVKWLIDRIEQLEDVEVQ